MSDKPVDPWPLQASPKPQRAFENGLSKEVVDAIYYQILGVVPSDPVSPVKQVDPAKPAGRTTQGRFNRGVSGNPKGRPRRNEPRPLIPPAKIEADSVSAIALKHGARKVKAQTDQGEVELTLVEAAMTKMVREAVRGNTGHSRTFMQLVVRAEAEEAKRKRDLFLYWSAEKEKAQDLHLQAELAGEEPPLSVHPDDIELYADGTFAIVGPTNPEAIKAMRQTHSRVDCHVVNIAYAQWVKKRWIRIHRRPIDGILYAELAFRDEQNDLPPRLKMPIEELEMRLRSYARYSGRVLHGFLRAKAQPLGLDVPPRESRKPMIIPTQVVELVKERKIGRRQLLEIWQKVESKLADAQVDELQAAYRGKPDPDT